MGSGYNFVELMPLPEPIDESWGYPVYGLYPYKPQRGAVQAQTWRQALIWHVPRQLRGVLYDVGKELHRFGVIGAYHGAARLELQFEAALSLAEVFLL